MDENHQLDEKLRGMLQDLGEALSDAIASSPELSGTLRRIRREGYSLYLLVDNRKGNEQPQPYELKAPRGLLKEAVFRIHGEDVTFLRSIGIDPTRSVRGSRDR